MAHKSKFLVDDATVTTAEDTESEASEDETLASADDNDSKAMHSSDEDYDVNDEEALEQYFTCSSAHAGKPKGISPEKLSKVWRIDLETAKRTLKVTTQRCSRPNNPEFSKNYPTGDRMLRYKKIKEYFFTDTFFATKKGGKSTRGHTCVQLFVTDKGFVHVIPMKRKKEMFQAMKQFAKEIGAPEAIICDAAKE